MKIELLNPKNNMDLIYVLLTVAGFCLAGGLILSLFIWVVLSIAAGHNELEDSDYEE